VPGTRIGCGNVVVVAPPTVVEVVEVVDFGVDVEVGVVVEVVEVGVDVEVGVVVEVGTDVAAPVVAGPVVA